MFVTRGFILAPAGDLDFIDLAQNPETIEKQEKGNIGLSRLPFSRRNGWGTRVRTWVNGARTRRPTTRRSPNKFFIKIYQTRLAPLFFYRCLVRAGLIVIIIGQRHQILESDTKEWGGKSSINF